jgi:hypothetical protein
MLFLGAGASHAFGIGQLQDFTTQVNRIFADHGYSRLIDHIHQTLVNANRDSQFFFDESEIDMEVILSVLELMAHPIQTAHNGGGPRILYLNQLLNSTYNDNIPQQQELDEIKRSIEEVIIYSCMNCDFVGAIEYYDSLFRFESSIALDYVNAIGGRAHTRLFKHTVTTNYDLILERFDEDYDRRFKNDRTVPAKHFLERGFTYGNYRWNEPYLDLTNLNLESNLDSIVYLKLHGSIDWWIRNSDQHVVSRECNHSMSGETYSKRLMIYPAYDKRTTRDPFSTLHNIFRRLLSIHEVYIVIGYSFRDFSINEAFLDALNSEASRMVIINPHPDRILGKINNFPNDKVDIIEIPFGDDRLIESLNDVLRRSPEGVN